MCVAVHRYGRVFMTENFGKRFYVDTVFDGASGKRMPEGMKTFVRFRFFIRICMYLLHQIEYKAVT